MKDNDDDKIELGKPDKLDFLKTDRKPYLCPVCYGHCYVPWGFYDVYPHGGTTNTAPEICRSCGGTGIIWG